ncbi:MAG: hypothetical protein IJQ28_06230 [Clostridia bacterium]|nr:hypothetical protein [Clostridia bacterium]
MDIERINTDITDIESAKRAIKDIAECIFIMNREFNRKIENLNSQNVKNLDLRITTLYNRDFITKKQADERYRKID